MQGVLLFAVHLDLGQSSVNPLLRDCTCGGIHPPDRFPESS